MSKPIYCECGRKIFVKKPRFGGDSRRKGLGQGGRRKGHDLCLQCMSSAHEANKKGFVRAKVITYRTVVYDRQSEGWRHEVASGADEGNAIRAGHEWIKSMDGGYERYYFRLEPVGKRNQFILDRGE